MDGQIRLAERPVACESGSSVRWWWMPPCRGQALPLRHAVEGSSSRSLWPAASDVPGVRWLVTGGVLPRVFFFSLAVRQSSAV